MEGEQPTFVACYEVAGLASFGESQQEIIDWIGLTFDMICLQQDMKDSLEREIARTHPHTGRK